MSAAAERATLAAIGADLVALCGDAGERRAATLLAPPAEYPPACFADLTAVPDWLRLPRDAQRRVAIRAALLALAPALAASIDGEWLGRMARLADEETLDWAMEQAGDLPAAGLSRTAADDVEATGFALLRAALPEALVGYLDWAPVAGTTPPASLATFCVERAAA